jgi:hypothetical protein
LNADTSCSSWTTSGRHSFATRSSAGENPRATAAATDDGTPLTGAASTRRRRRHAAGSTLGDTGTSTTTAQREASSGSIGSSPYRNLVALDQTQHELRDHTSAVDRVATWRERDCEEDAERSPSRRPGIAGPGVTYFSLHV